jgi:hypothetical protein
VRDNHEVHLAILMPFAQQAGQGVMNGQVGTAIFKSLVAHIGEHHARAMEQGADKEKLKPVDDFLKKAGPALAQLEQMDAQAGQLAEASAAHDAEEAGAPPQI